MDYRLEPRHPANVNVHVTAVGDTGRSGPGVITEISESGLRVLVNFPVKPGNSLRIDVDGTRLWGYIVHSHEDERGFTAGLELIQVLVGGETISALLRGLVQYASVPAELTESELSKVSSH